MDFGRFLKNLRKRNTKNIYYKHYLDKKKLRSMLALIAIDFFKEDYFTIMATFVGSACPQLGSIRPAATFAIDLSGWRAHGLTHAFQCIYTSCCVWRLRTCSL